MSLRTEWIRYGENDEYLGFTAVAERAAAPLPAVIVLQEAGGVDAHIEDVTRRIALAGYFAIAPDLFAVGGERPPELTRERLAEMMDFFNALTPGTITDASVRAAELARRPDDQAARLTETLAKFMGGALQLDQYLPHMRATAVHLRSENQATRGQKIGVMGFCLGGGLTALYACHDPDLAAAAIFYGMSPDASLAVNVACPVLGFYGASDPRVNGTIPAFAGAMKAAGKRFEPHVYEGADHAFFNDSRNSYHAGAARDAYARLLDLFRRELA